MLNPRKEDMVKKLKILARLKQIQSILERLKWDKSFYFDENTVKPRCSIHKIALKQTYERGVSDSGNYPYDPIPGWWVCSECPSDNRMKYVPLNEEIDNCRSHYFWDLCYDCEQLIHMDTTRNMLIEGERRLLCGKCFIKRR